MPESSIPRMTITSEQEYKLHRLNQCRFYPGSPDKRFVRQMQGATELTPKQADYLDRLWHRYRRQIDK